VGAHGRQARGTVASRPDKSRSPSILRELAAAAADHNPASLHDDNDNSDEAQ